MLALSCQSLPGVGPTIAAKLAQCGINTVEDLLFHLPFRYQDRTRITPIRDVRRNEFCVVAGHIVRTEITSGKRLVFYCHIADKTGMLKLQFFHFNQQQIKQFKPNMMIRAFGEIREFAHTFSMTHPEYHIFEEGAICAVEETLTPIYSTTQGLSQTKLRQLVKIALQSAHVNLCNLEWMSQDELLKNQLQDIPTAMHQLHNPPPDIAIHTIEEGKHPALKRLVIDELLAQKLSMQFARLERAALEAPKLEIKTDLCQRFIQSLPFTLTKAQQRVYQEIENDLALKKPMLRLVQGDVGAGKTVIAALAAIKAIANGYQVALMAPTDLLSEQHAQTIAQWFQPLGIDVRRLSGKMKVSLRRETLNALKTHQCQIIIGTHALFQSEVEFARLGLVIIDEQHRFGVEQRLQLLQKGQICTEIPHQLLMTATPIPRTLAMTQFAHLDLSIIDELPPGRTPVITTVLNQEKRAIIIERLKSAIENGRQIYWVCTLIDDSEKLQCMAAIETHKNLQEQLPNARVGLIHGKMSVNDKENTMRLFKQGEIDLLVATTVIEVGVDVPNASLMIIENSERLGLSQLHQLRGRVGRGVAESHCVLLYQSPLSSHSNERLRVMKATTDGFVIAEKDLTLRGSGDFLGTRQTGYKQYKIANLERDHALLPLVADLANNLIKSNIDLAYIIANRWLGDFKQFLQG